ncbi:hypothetical protein RISW2_00795 [Roseivivax isoporae LMG 25204]|uniref:UPF0102 protein RISW2_00795 n=1 Tax=Roseivivax isoporae LMG 25204 TaxID=1449351 RepID=X7FG16_9RHOB|nr:hypothetical protein RISW2_00795 [Roseivivax isoporae LMG 25204]
MGRAARGRTGHLAGLSAEARVAQHYVERGCTVADRRWRGAGGEIDLVVSDGPVTVFVEVKKGRSFAGAAERLGRRQMDRLCAAAEEYLGGLPGGLLTEMRFDVALMDAQGAVRVIENAFGAP